MSSALIGDQEKLAFRMTSVLSQTYSPRTIASAASFGWTANASRTRTGGEGAAGATASTGVRRAGAAAPLPPGGRPGGTAALIPPVKGITAPFPGGKADTKVSPA